MISLVYYQDETRNSHLVNKGYGNNEKMSLKENKITIIKKLRPIRLAFLIAKEDKRTLNEVFRINTSLWGGIFNPIIPFFKKTPKNWRDRHFPHPTASSILEGYIDSFDPDYIVVKDKKIIPASFFERERILKFEEILTIKDEYCISYGVDITDLYWHLYNIEFKFLRRHPIKVFIPKPSKNMALFSACSFGEFQPSKEMDYIKKYYSHCLNPKEITIDQTNFLDCFINRGLSPLQITRAELNVSPRGRRVDPSLFFMDATSWLDIVDYWNLRAIGRDVLPLPKQYADNYIKMCNKIIKRNFIPYKQNKNMMHGTTFICSRSSTKEEMQTFTKKLNLPGEGAISLQNWYPRMWDEWAKSKDHVELCSVMMKEDTEEVFLDNNSLRFKGLSPEFVEKFGGNGKPRWINIIRFSDFYKRYKCPSVFPHNLKDFNRLLGVHSFPHSWISFGGINIPCIYSDLSHFFKIPTNFKVFEAWFREKGYEIELSGAGQILLKIIDSVGGIQGVRTFQDEEIIILLNEMSHSAVEMVIEESGEQSKKTKVRAKTVNVKTWRGLLTKINNNSNKVGERHLLNLINYKILKGGILLQCPGCAQHTWYSLDDLSDKVICERCLEKFDFPIVRPVSKENWHLRTIGPFSIEDYAQGGYCVALSLRFFGDLGMSNDMTWIPSFLIENKNNNQIEVDFGIFLSQDPFDEIKRPIAIFGECKSFNIFKKEDVTHMKEIADNFPGSVIVFCTLRSSLTNPEKKLIAKLARRGRNHYKADQWRNPILILTGIELFSIFGPPSCWENKGDSFKAFVKNWRVREEIQELCEVTQQLHLGIESYWEWYEQKRKKKLKTSNKMK